MASTENAPVQDHDPAPPVSAELQQLGVVPVPGLYWGPRWPLDWITVELLKKTVEASGCWYIPPSNRILKKS